MPWFRRTVCCWPSVCPVIPSIILCLMHIWWIFSAISFVGACHNGSDNNESSPEIPPCEEGCPKIWSPVCGKDDEEYREFDNDCLLGVFNCKNNKSEIEFNESESCAINLIISIQCTDFVVVDYIHCKHVSYVPSQQTLCPATCAEIWDPVCGKRGLDEYREFGNECHFKKYNCRNRDQGLNSIEITERCKKLFFIKKFRI